MRRIQRALHGKRLRFARTAIVDLDREVAGGAPSPRGSVTVMNLNPDRRGRSRRHVTAPRAESRRWAASGTIALLVIVGIWTVARAPLAYSQTGASMHQLEVRASPGPFVVHHSGVACPDPPSGWRPDVANPSIYGPVQNPGQNHEAITCTYLRQRDSIQVTAEVALPSDLNPLDDFYYGCGSRHETWGAATRLYLVESRKSWSYAEFADPDREVPAGDVTAFETATRSLLQNVQPLAHECRINTTTPTTVRQVYLFAFELLLKAPDFDAFGGISSASAGNSQIPSASFTTVAGIAATTTFRVVSVAAPRTTLTITDSRGTHTVLLDFDPGVSFSHRPPTEVLRLNVRIARSDYAGCHVGSTGTVVLLSGLQSSTSSRVELNICGSTFRRGSERATVEIVPE